MARFVSNHAKFRFIVRGDVYMTLVDGQRQQTVRPLVAGFSDDVLTPDEIEFGIKNMTHKGLPMDKGTEEELSPRPRISGFDSFKAQEFSGWTDEEREMVENALRNSGYLGIDYLELVPVPTVVPWPTYDTTSAVDVLSIAQATGTLEQAVAYEQENQKRSELLRVLEEALSGPQVEVDAPVVIEA